MNDMYKSVRISQAHEQRFTSFAERLEASVEPVNLKPQGFFQFFLASNHHFLGGKLLVFRCLWSISLVQK